MKIRVTESVCLQPCATGYHVTLGRRSNLLDPARAQLIASCAAGIAEMDDLVQRVAGETGEAAPKLQSTDRKSVV